MTDPLQEAAAKIKPGDTVTLRYEKNGHPATLTGETWSNDGWLRVGPLFVRKVGGEAGACLREVIEHIPAPEPEPKPFSHRRDRTGYLWASDEDGDWGKVGMNSHWLSWRELNDEHGPLTDPTALGLGASHRHPDPRRDPMGTGWGYPTLAARKAHYFVDGRSLCGKYGCFGVNLTPHLGAVTTDDCVACARKLDTPTQGETP